MKFLQQVADYYITNDVDMRNLVFVFPNRRSAMFMRKYLKEAAKKTTFMPRMVSVTYFTQQFCDTELASDAQLLFILYRSYCKVLERHGKKDQIPTFDGFAFWGNILVNDFSDVDAYMADPRQLFRNLKNEKEISANYLTPEQKEVIRILWGEQAATSEDIKSFWKHVPSDPRDKSLSGRFLSLWMIMEELYDTYNHDLMAEKPKLAYSGAQSKEAWRTIKDMSLEDFNGKRYAMIGFNVLSTARILIFKRLKELGIADFFWDTAFIDSRLESEKRDGGDDPATTFIAKLSRQFPSPDDFSPQPISDTPDIEIIAVPSNTAQAKVASTILEEWSRQWTEQGKEDMGRQLINTSIVLPDDKMLMPMLYSLPPALTPINVTMGLKYASTPFAALMSAIISMHLRARKQKDAYYYYYQDVQQVLKHPHLALIAGDEGNVILQEINDHHLFRISANELVEKHPNMAFVFRSIDNPNDIDEVKDYVLSMLTGVERRLSALVDPGAEEDYYELRILDGLISVVEELCFLASKYDINMGSETFFRILDRTLAGITLKFVGKPLKGLQIMGVMDTRALDFDNVIMMSLNEGTFPPHNYTPSLIPGALRLDYGMPVQKHHESTYAYQFFRLISRAKSVKLLYDSRNKGLSAGEMSRYLSQLIHLGKYKNVTFSALELTAQAPKSKEIKIDKTQEVIEELRLFRPGGNRYLSASALKTYLNCPLEFYLQYVKNIRVNDNVMEYIDAASYGTVIHALAQSIYQGHEGENITESFIDEIIKNTDLVVEALKMLNEKYYRGAYTGRLDDMPGEGKIIAKIIARYITEMLKEEKKLTPFTFVGAEVGDKEKFVWKIDDKHTLNLHMSIDRIDRLPDGTLRFIDYKTGGDELSSSTVANLFQTKEKVGGIFQLLAYSHAYASIYGESARIKPVIYKFQEIVSKGITDIKLRTATLDDYRQADESTDKDPGYYDLFKELIDKIFEEENVYPFIQTDNMDNCMYCHFKQMCGRYPEKKY